MAGSGREALRKGCESSTRAGRGTETLLKRRDWSGGHLNEPEVVLRLFLFAGNGRKAFSKRWECSGGPPGGTVVVKKPSRRVGSGRKALPEG